MALVQQLSPSTTMGFHGRWGDELSYPTNLSLSYIAVPNTPGYQAADHTVTWAFSDSTVATGSSVSKAWATVGSKVAVATATNNITMSTGTATKTITIKNPPNTFTTTFTKTKAYYANGKAFVVFGEQSGSYEAGFLSANDATTLIARTSPDASELRIINYGSCSSDISADGNWICSLGTTNANVAKVLHVLNTTTNVAQRFDIATIDPSYLFTDIYASCMIVARPDNKFAVSIQNSTWWHPATFIYDPVTNTYSSLVTGTYAYTSGLVINAGNDYVYCFARSAYNAAPLANTAKYRISTHTWSEFVPSGTGLTLAGNGSWREPSVCKMADGKFIVVGGWNGNSGNVAVNTVGIFDPATGALTLKASLGTARHWPMVALLPNGNILAAGGTTGYTGTGIGTAEVYDPVANTWTVLTAPMLVARGCAGIAQLPSGNFIIAGGTNAAGTVLNSVEYFHPADNVFYSVD